MKTFPLNKKPRLTTDKMSFQTVDYSRETEIPINLHVGAFGVKRKNHHHEGVDLYCPQGTEVYAMEDGEVVMIENFTGPAAGSDWWNDTKAIHVEGESGVIVYGEVIPCEQIKVGHKIKQGEMIANVEPVLKKDKGRPMSMLHLELYKHGSRQTVEWHPMQDDVPEFLQDPTLLLIDAMYNLPEVK